MELELYVIIIKISDFSANLSRNNDCTPGKPLRLGLGVPHISGQYWAADLKPQLGNSQPLNERKHRFQEGSRDRVTKNVKCHRVVESGKLK